MPLLPIRFDIWGCRGSRSFLPVQSRVGNSTSCYSVLAPGRMLVLDAGWGLPALGYAMETDARFAGVRRVDLFVSHAHCDHWEGLKDVGWFWKRDNGLDLTIWGSHQAITSIEEGFAHPSYVPLNLLSMGTLSSLKLQSVKAGDARDIEGWDVSFFPLNHASGAGPLDTLGFRVGTSGGPYVSYLLDHEPTPATRAMELAMMKDTHLAVFDAHFSLISEQRYGHGSQEHTALMARESPGALVLAGHHGPMYSDEALRENFRRHAQGLPNFRLAVEGDSYGWDPATRRFEEHGAEVVASGAPLPLGAKA